MRFSLSVAPFREPGARDPFARTYELCRIAEDAGFDTAMIGHHHFTPSLPSDPFVLLAAIAARTGTLRLATAVYLLAIHHPLDVAERVAMLDQISGGRATLGVGLGWNPIEYAAFGADVHQRGARLDEALTVLTRAWTGETAAHAGRFWTIPEVTVHPRPVQEPHPPLWVAGVAARAIERAARLGDVWICDPVQNESYIAHLLTLYRAACAARGREPAWLLRRYVWLGSTRDRDERWLPGFVAQQLEYWRVSAEGPEERALFARLDAGHTVDAAAIARGRFLAGPPREVVAQIERLHQTSGCDHLSIGFGGGMSGRRADLTSEGQYREMRAMVEQFAREVMPVFH